MVIIGIDAHKRTHTAVAIDEHGRQLATRTTHATTSADHLELIRWADQLGPGRSRAVEDCRHLSRRLEADLLAAGERIVRVPPKLMAHARDAARSYGKSDPIDALAIARAAAREPDLPVAHLDEVARALRLLVDHREDLLAERTRHINRLRWHLHEIDPGWDPKPQALITYKHLALCTDRLGGVENVVGTVALDLVARIRALTFDIRRLETEIAERTTKIAPALLHVHGVAALSAAKIISRSGNRQLNAALHRIAVTQARAFPEAIAYLERRQADGNTRTEAFRALKRRLSDVVYRALVADAALTLTEAAAVTS